VIKRIKVGGHVEIAFCTHDSSEKNARSQPCYFYMMSSHRNHYMQFHARTLFGNKNFKDNLALIINKADPCAVFLPLFGLINTAPTQRFQKLL
jgi:hypothetical protein